jgi:hypothetical protein
MDVYQESNTIAGGIDVKGKIITSGGSSRVVGENAKWHMRNKYIKLKESKNLDARDLIKIVNLKLPLTFDRRMDYFDTEDEVPHSKTPEESSAIIHKKIISVLTERLNESTNSLIKRLITEYKLCTPLFWVLGDIIKFLSTVYKKKSSKKIKISPEMSTLVEKIWRTNDYSYVVNSSDAPSNLVELMIHMMQLIDKPNISGLWVEPQLTHIKYPCWCSILKQNAIKSIVLEKSKLLDTTAKMSGDELVKAYIFTLLNIENIVIEHINDIEQYFVQTAQNMSAILNSLKTFFDH